MWVNRAVLEHVRTSTKGITSTKIINLKYECTISDSPRRIVEVDGQQFSCSLADLSHVRAQLSFYILNN